MKLHAIVDVNFKIGNSARLGGSDFSVIAHKDDRMKIAANASDLDRVSVETGNHDASIANGSRITLRTTDVKVVKTDVNVPISISGYKSVKSDKTVNVIRGLKTRVTRGNDLVFDFVPM